MALSSYTIDPDMSRLTVRAFAGGMLSVFGHDPVIGLRKLSGEAQYDAGAPESGTLHVKTDAASLEIENDASEKDRREMTRVMREEVLEVSSYPEITFDSTQVEPASGRLVIHGNISLHGATRQAAIPAFVNVLGDTLRANGEFSLLQTNFGIKLVSVAGGTLKLKDELKLTFEVVARRKS